MITIKWDMGDPLASVLAPRILQTIELEGGFYFHNAALPGLWEHETLREMSRCAAAGQPFLRSVPLQQRSLGTG